MTAPDFPPPVDNSFRDELRAAEKRYWALREQIAWLLGRYAEHGSKQELLAALRTINECEQ